MGRCVECDADLPGFEKLCKQCWEERYLDFAHPKPRHEWRDKVALVRQAPVTVALVLLNVAVFLAMVFSGVSSSEPSLRDLIKWGAGYGPLTLSGQWWRLLTAMFVHVNAEHLLFNMICLLDLGILAEPALGSATFVTCYLAAGFAASMLSLFFHRWQVCAGASGAIFGMAGLLIAPVFFGTVKLSIRKVARPLNALVRFVIYNIAYGLLIPVVDNSAHIGGLLMGLTLGTVLSFTRDLVVVQLPPPETGKSAGASS